jgi:hypothetical protein
MQFSPNLTTVRARTCTTRRFVYVLIANLRCWLYPHIQFRLNFYTSASYHCKISRISNNNKVRLFWVPDHYDIKGNEEADRQVRMGLSHFCGMEPCVPVSASIVWVIDAHSKHWIALNSCRLLSNQGFIIILHHFLSIFISYFLLL